MKKSTHFILIDDERISNVLTSIFIKDVFTNANINAFTHPLEGVQFIRNAFKENPVKTILFLDINMPTVTGWDVLDIMEEIPENILDFLTIYILSSSVDPLDKIKATNHKLLTGYLEKPLSINALQTIMHSMPTPVA